MVEWEEPYLSAKSSGCGRGRSRKGFNVEKNKKSKIVIPYIVHFNQPVGSATLRIAGWPPEGFEEAGLKYVLGSGDSKDDLSGYRQPLTHEEARGKRIIGKYLYIAIVKDDKTLYAKPIDTEQERPLEAAGSVHVSRKINITLEL